MTRILKHEQKCDLVICLSHLGYQYKNDPDKISDTKLATLTKDIDLIIGGHTHTFLDKPTILKNLEGKDVIVNQVGCYGLNLGRIDFYFDNDKSKIKVVINTFLLTPLSLYNWSPAADRLKKPYSPWLKQCLTAGDLQDSKPNECGKQRYSNPFPMPKP